LNYTSALKKIKENMALEGDVKEIIDFIERRSKRGIIRI